MTAKKRSYAVWCADYGQTEDDAETIQTEHGPFAAAEEWAEISDSQSADYLIVGGECPTVSVRCPDGKVVECIVYGESVASYTARLKIETEEQP